MIYPMIIINVQIICRINHIFADEWWLNEHSEHIIVHVKWCNNKNYDNTKKCLVSFNCTRWLFFFFYSINENDFGRCFRKKSKSIYYHLVIRSVGESIVAFTR